MSAPDEWVARIVAEADARAASWRLLTLTDFSSEAELAAGEPDAVRSDRQTSATLRVRHDGRLGTATATYPVDPSLLVDDAVRAARLGPAADPLTGPTGSEPAAIEAPGDDTAADALRTFAAETADFQRAHGLRLDGTIRRQVHDVGVHGPDGNRHFRRAWWHQALVAEGRAGAGALATCTDWTPEPALSESWAPWLAWTAACQELPDVDVSTDSCPVVLAPLALHALLSPVVAGLSGASAADAYVLHPALRLDDSAQDDWPLRAPVDDEGTATAPLTLLGDGKPVARYHSEATAAARGERPTGHGFHGSPAHRRPLQPATPVLTAARLTAAPAYRVPGFADLVASVGSGVLIESLLGSHQHAAPRPVVEGRIRAGVLLENGAPVARLSGQPVALDLRELLGPGFRAATEATWPVGRSWHGRMPFALADGLAL